MKTRSTVAEETVEVFHRWNAELDVSERTVTFYVSKGFSTSKEEAETVDPNDPYAWDKVLVLPFPESNDGERDGEAVTFAANPIFFDHTQLARRFIPVDVFVNVVTRIMHKINTDLSVQIQLQKSAEESGWNIL